MKEYVLKASLRNGKILFLKEIKNEYPFKTPDIAEAQSFSSKAKAWASFRTIPERNIGYERWELVLRNAK